ncbi:Aste57867_12239 [Aphanomyces stellatus]|uniref:phosphomevalonate kinase n=1 Tax=Aphanomyces stellatus TaxID=120398 RepID=A0A485KV08_9STRA|nr:hypothetical protein As57867_012194 [Aphanomyces stellatus]VFT89093.1 Aste57867_12239 [Aphanomyces stellatus]
MRVSAPGKVLIAGGYLVLEPELSGAVLAASSRFHTTVDVASLDATTSTSFVPVRIHSPQFHQTMHGELIATTFRFTKESAANPYVEKTIRVCVAALVGLLGATAFSARVQDMLDRRQCLMITLEADNDFYSQRDQLQRRGLSVSRANLKTLPAFLPSLQDDAGAAKIAKTGMGSSAALITSLVGALVGFFGAAALPTRTHHDATTRAGLDLVHNLAQLCHSIAQEKIGSGFDVSAASYGNQRYNRFRPDLIQAFLGDESECDPTALAACLTSSWDNLVRPFTLPDGMHMIMGDVNAGSATVSMVRKVLAWKQTDPAGSAALWATLNAKNDAIPTQLAQLHATTAAAGSGAAAASLAVLATKSHMEWVATDAVVGPLLVSLRDTFLDIRRLLRRMGDAAGVPIEPADQTALIDATMDVPGVLFAGVPGAGGNDAIFAIVLDAAVLDRVEAFWGTWTATSCGHWREMGANGCVYRVSAMLVDVAPNGWQGGLLHEDDK